jgi:hypothetical protein
MGGRHATEEVVQVGKALQHPLRAISAVLTLVAAVIVFVVLAATAAAGRPSGKDGVWFYETNNFGKSDVHSVGNDEVFAIIGKNLNHATAVYCWSVVSNDWVVADWAHFNSRVLWFVNPNTDCTGSDQHGMAVLFDDGSFIEGPRIIITP